MPRRWTVIGNTFRFLFHSDPDGKTSDYMTGLQMRGITIRTIGINQALLQAFLVVFVDVGRLRRRGDCLGIFVVLIAENLSG